MRLNIFTNPLRTSLPSPDYEISLEGLSRIELLQEYEEICADFYSAKSPSKWRKLMLCRRVMARRLFRLPGNAA